MKIIIVIYFLVLSCSCEKISTKGDSLVVYKTKNDYSQNIYIRVNSVRTKTISFPGLSDIDTIEEKLPKKLVNGYFLGTQRNGEVGINSVVTSLTINSYKTYISPDSLVKLVIDYDPFIEYYKCDDNSIIENFKNDIGIDTAKLNEVIIKNELTKYFARLK